MQVSSKSLPHLLQAVRQSVAAMENADDEASATAAFHSLKEEIEILLVRTEELREEYYRQKTTIVRQSQALVEAELDRAGERAPAEAKTPQIALHQPDVITFESHPDCLFLKLPDGSFLNLLQIAFLDLTARTLYLSGGIIRQITDEATLKKIAFHLSLFQKS